MQTQEDIIYIPFEIMEKFMIDVLMASNINLQDAKIISDVLIEADKQGIDSHGIGRLKSIYYDRIKDGIVNPVTKIEILKETQTTAVLDANNGMGHVVSYQAMNLAIQKAKEFGMGMCAVTNSSHFGIAGYYAKMATTNGMIGIVGTNARPSVAPTFGVENMLGTNPLTLGVPTDEAFDFILDCATSISQRGKIEKYEREGKDTPAGMVIDESGKTRTDTEKILEDLVKGTAALAPLGGIGEETAGYKGYGYSVFVEILSAALQNGPYMKMLNGFDENGQKIPYRLGHFFIAINTQFFMGEEIFRNIAGNILRELRASKKMPSESKIYTAGEKEYLTYLERKDKGVPVNNALKKQMIQMRDEKKLDYKFKFE
jgi:LDH2 family malate/lactate/ureidoglycolate dehydrogenase